MAPNHCSGDHKCSQSSLEAKIEILLLNIVNEFANIFRENFTKMMQDAECLGDNEEIIVEKMQIAFMNRTLDVDFLCESLGREK